MIKTLITFPYELARLPLVIVDNRLSEKLSQTSRPRVALDRTIGSADKLVGSLLGNRDIGARGADRLERSDKRLTTARLEQEADTRREQARETAEAGRREAAQKRKKAQDRAASGLEEADAAEARGKQAATAKAAKTAVAKKAAADQRAESRAATVERRKKSVDSAADARKQAAKQTAKAELDDARETKQSAAEARADAERLRDLAEVKKQERKQD
jgi:hypothetical protein